MLEYLLSRRECPMEWQLGDLAVNLCPGRDPIVIPYPVFCPSNLKFLLCLKCVPLSMNLTSDFPVTIFFPLRNF